MLAFEGSRLSACGNGPEVEVVWCGDMHSAICAAVDMVSTVQVDSLHGGGRVAVCEVGCVVLVIRFAIGAARGVVTWRGTWRYLYVLVGCCPSSYLPRILYDAG